MSKTRTPTAVPDAPPGAAPLSRAIRAELEWLANVIDLRIRSYFGQDPKAATVESAKPPRHAPGSSRYADLLHRIDAGFEERIVLALALAPHVAPQVLDVFFLRNEKAGRGFTEFGGVKGVNHSGFLPTGETALFLLSGDDLGRRFSLLHLFEPEHPLYREGVLRGTATQPDEPLWSGTLTLSSAYLRYLVTGDEHRPDFSAVFPAKRLETRLAWTDLVLDDQVLEELGEISAWARHRREILEQWPLGRQLKPGFRSLFYGPPGTGKTLTASLLGKELGVDVYRVDLSQVVSKYIGETEKNLAQVFNQAENKNWILFFDEADALFGRRTATSSSHDRYANQEVSYLLQRVEDHPGIVILATNLKSNMDDAFARRFQSTIYFPPPTAEMRRRLWENGFGRGTPLAADVDLAKLARDFELTGGQIVNVIRHAALMAVQRPDRTVRLEDVHRGIRREYKKEGRAI